MKSTSSLQDLRLAAKPVDLVTCNQTMPTAPPSCKHNCDTMHGKLGIEKKLKLDRHKVVFLISSL